MNDRWRPTEEFNDEDSRGRQLWLEAYDACDGDRDAMWEWVAERYLHLLDTMGGHPPDRENERDCQ